MIHMEYFLQNPEAIWEYLFTAKEKPTGWSDTRIVLTQISNAIESYTATEWLHFLEEKRTLFSDPKYQDYIRKHQSEIEQTVHGYPKSLQYVLQYIFSNAIHFSEIEHDLCGPHHVYEGLLNHAMKIINTSHGADPYTKALLERAPIEIKHAARNYGIIFNSEWMLEKDVHVSDVIQHCKHVFQRVLANKRVVFYSKSTNTSDAVFEKWSRNIVTFLENVDQDIANKDEGLIQLIKEWIPIMLHAKTNTYKANYDIKEYLSYMTPMLNQKYNIASSVHENVSFHILFDMSFTDISQEIDLSGIDWNILGDLHG